MQETVSFIVYTPKTLKNGPNWRSVAVGHPTLGEQQK